MSAHDIEAATDRIVALINSQPRSPRRDEIRAALGTPEPEPKTATEVMARAPWLWRKEDWTPPYHPFAHMIARFAGELDADGERTHPRFDELHRLMGRIMEDSRFELFSWPDSPAKLKRAYALAVQTADGLNLKIKCLSP